MLRNIRFTNLTAYGIVVGVGLTWYTRPAARAWVCGAAPGEAAAFHAGLPDYRPTPLTEMPLLATELGVDRLFVKDESFRMGLNAFKVLGASWAIHRTLASRPSGHVGPVALVAATDGNHGRAVARMASMLGLPAHVYVPDLVPRPAIAAIAAEGATVTVVTGSYDDAVRRAATAADRDGFELIQDSAWPGYDEIPRWIVDGYATLFAEIDTQLGEAGAAPAGLVAVPMGVGSLAQAAVVHYRCGRTEAATVLGVEPVTAACVLASLADRELRTVPTGATMMAGLNCGTPSSVAWPYLRDGMDAAVAVTDAEATLAVGDLAAAGISSGPSGAAALAGTRAVLTDTERRARLSANHTRTAVVLNTEGATE